jgi:NifU-like protein involved in Fe-S cluster formation
MTHDTTVRTPGRRVTGHSGHSPGQGPFMNVTLTVADGAILEATYETYLCPSCHDCGKAVCAMVKGVKVDVARGVNRDTIAARVGPLPRAKQICYSLAAVALAEALSKLGNPE